MNCHDCNAPIERCVCSPFGGRKKHDINRVSDFKHVWLDTPYNELTDEQLKAVADWHQGWGNKDQHRACVYMMVLRTEIASKDANLKKVEIERGKVIDKMVAELADERERADKAKAAKDGAYLERNQCVALIARMAIALGYWCGTAKTAIEGWSEDWHGCVYIDLPAGQVSWHYHDSQAHLFDWLPPYCGEWDGHDTPEKYRRVLSRALLPNAYAAELNAERAKVERLDMSLRQIIEEWAGSECGHPVYAQEAYAIRIAKRMAGIAGAALEDAVGGADHV